MQGHRNNFLYALFSGLFYIQSTSSPPTGRQATSLFSQKREYLNDILPLSPSPLGEELG